MLLSILSACFPSRVIDTKGTWPDSAEADSAPDTGTQDSVRDSPQDSPVESSSDTDTNSPDTDTGALPSTWISVSAGYYYSCGVRSDFTAACWGENLYNQADVPNEQFIAISTMLPAACGIKTDGEVLCWGDPLIESLILPTGPWNFIDCNDLNCILMNETGNIQSFGLRSFASDTTISIDTFIAVSIASEICGILETGSVMCWKENELPYNPTSGSFVNVASGFGVSGAIDQNGTLTCWNNSTYDPLYDIDIPPIGIFFHSADFSSANGCGITDTQEAICWGYPYEWQGSSSIAPPTGTFTQISSGQTHNCGLTDSGTIECWGWNQAGECTPPP